MDAQTEKAIITRHTNWSSIHLEVHQHKQVNLSFAECLAEDLLQSDTLLKFS
jgi:hypothetical protein